MNLQQYLKQQAQLQKLMAHPMGIGDEAIRENVLALIVEVTELLQEFNWKVWRVQKKQCNRQKIVHELADIMKFYCNILNTLRITEEEFDVAWNQVHKKVMKRINDDY
jgi:dimeric dUTPase (all-alpha-NTP-PPase superfamily)